jgi:hypothetical protein
VQLRTFVAVAATMVTLGGSAAAPAASTAQVGYAGPSFSGLNAEASGGAVTGQKPESKLWYNDGGWWATMIAPAGAHTIHRLGGTSWQDTGVVVDSRVTSREDVLSLGATLYVLVRASSGSNKLVRFGYAGGTYTLSPGFPVDVPGAGAETATLARDSTGTLWLTYAQAGEVRVAHTLGSDASWGSAFTIPGASGLSSDDISAVIAFTDAVGPAVGVMWSNQNDNTQHFAVHRDGAADGAWTTETALTGINEADDHINLKSFGGSVYAVVKTSLDNAGSAAPLIKLLVRSPSGTWSDHRVATVGENNTRPITVLQIDPATRSAYVFMTVGVGAGARGIAYKQTSLDSINFPANNTTFIEGPNNEVINDATSTKQNLDASTGIVVAASDGSRYWWNRIDGSGPPANAAPTASPGTASTAKDAPVAIALQGQDAETCELVFSIVSQPAHGTLGPVANSACTPAATGSHSDAATVTYTPTTGYTGADSFSFQVSDGALASALATVSITVNETSPPPAGGITFRSASGAGNATATSLTLPAPAETVPGDVLLAAIDVRGAPAITAPAGSVLVRQDQNGNTIKQAVYRKTAAVSEPASYTWTFSSAQGASGGVSAYGGVDPSAPVAAHAGQVNTSSTQIAAPSITTTGPGQLVVGVFGTARATKVSPPAGYAERLESSSTGGTYRATTELADGLQSSPGASGRLVAVASGSAASVGQTLALKPAAGSPPPPPNTAPTASAGVASTPKDTPLTIVLRGVDAENCELAFSIVSGPGNGTVGPLSAQPCSAGSPNSDTATVTYTPAPGFAGPDSFSFQVSDGALSSAPATISITVNDTTPPPAGAIAFRSASSGGNGTANSLTLPAPAGIATGDLLLAAVDVRGSPTITAPAGWTLVRSDQSGYTIKQSVYYKIAGSSEPASYTWTFASSQGASGGIAAYIGVDTSAPIAATAGQANAASTQITAPSVTTTGPNQLVVGLFGTAVATTVGQPAGFAERYEASSTAGTYRATSELSDRLQTSAGSTGTLVATAGASATSIGQTIVLR